MGQKVKGKIDRKATIHPDDPFEEGPRGTYLFKHEMKTIKLRKKPNTDDLTPRGNLPKRSLPSGYQDKGKKPGSGGGKK